MQPRITSHCNLTKVAPNFKGNSTQNEIFCKYGIQRHCYAISRSHKTFKCKGRTVSTYISVSWEKREHVNISDTEEKKSCFSDLASKFPTHIIFKLMLMSLKSYPSYTMETISKYPKSFTYFRLSGQRLLQNGQNYLYFVISKGKAYNCIIVQFLLFWITLNKN